MIINQGELPNDQGFDNHPRLDIPFNKLHEISVGYTIPRIFPRGKHTGLAQYDPTTFTFTNHGMSDETLKWIVRLLKMNFSSLTTFKVTFVDCFSLKDKGMENLGQIARYLPQLKQLNIDFCVTDGVTAEGLEKIGCELSRNLKNLESLSLSFQEFYLAGRDPEFERLIASMGKYFGRLKHLVLDFSHSESLTNKGLDAVVQQIPKNFKALQKFNLRIIGCESINYENLGHIPEVLSFIPQFDLTTKSPW